MRPTSVMGTPEMPASLSSSNTALTNIVYAFFSLPLGSAVPGALRFFLLGLPTDGGEQRRGQQAAQRRTAAVRDRRAPASCGNGHRHDHEQQQTQLVVLGVCGLARPQPGQTISKHANVKLVM
jgi:hypothetical protein